MAAAGNGRGPLLPVTVAVRPLSPDCTISKADDSGHRKQACSGGEPCDRCQKDDRACTYGERDPKTALTRARMTELESR